MPGSDMQEKKNRILLATLALLIGAVFASFILLRNKDGFKVDKGLYSKTDLNTVEKVELSSGSGNVVLELKGGRWLVNDAFQADRNMLEVLFATLKQVEAKRALATSQRDSIRKELMSKGTTVSLYSGGELVERFIAGGNLSRTQAYFMREDGTGPHLVVIPGYRVFVTGVFELSAGEWREKLIFDFNWRNFRSLQATFRNPAGNFQVEMQKGLVSVKDVVETDTARLNTFLDQISLLRVEAYVNTDKKLDSLGRTLPLAGFTISDIGDRTFFLKVYEMDQQFYGFIHGNQWAILPEKRVLGLLRPKEFFEKR
jgi:hypothetical protein